MYIFLTQAKNHAIMSVYKLIFLFILLNIICISCKSQSYVGVGLNMIYPIATGKDRLNNSNHVKYQSSFTVGVGAQLHLKKIGKLEFSNGKLSVINNDNDNYLFKSPTEIISVKYFDFSLTIKVLEKIIFQDIRGEYIENQLKYGIRAGGYIGFTYNGVVKTYDGVNHKISNFQKKYTGLKAEFYLSYKLGFGLVSGEFFYKLNLNKYVKNEALSGTLKFNKLGFQIGYLIPLNFKKFKKRSVDDVLKN